MLKIAVTALILTILLSCVHETTSAVRIGAILPLTGPASAIGEGMRETLEWKLDELKAEGKDIEFLIEDSQSDPKQAVTAFKSIVEIKNTEIVFTVLSSVGLALKPLAEEKQILLWADITHPETTKNSQFVLRHANTVEKDSFLLVEHIKNKSFSKISIIHQQDDWGQAMSDEILGLLKQSNIEAENIAIDHKESDFRTPLFKAIQKKSEAIIFIAVGPAAGLLIKQAKELNFEGAVYSSVGFILTPDAQKIAGDFAKGTFYTTYLSNEEFDKDYRARFGKQPSISGFVSYTDIELLFYAIDQIQSTEPEHIIKFVKSLKEFKGKYETVTISSSGDITVPTVIRVWGA